ncbi:hypothetical protein BDQ17DRAFT_1435250 [Cyathus striatus]|nr:hypothetical protein BDQ17DRAFT_1435250 [Cyathus striatus]
MVHAGGMPQPRVEVDSSGDEDKAEDELGPSSAFKAVASVKLAKRPETTALYQWQLVPLAAHIHQPGFLEALG